MTALVLPWWRERSRREQILLLVLAVLVLAITLGFGVLRPLAQARAEAADRLSVATVALGDVRGMAAAIRAAEVRTRPAEALPTIERVGSRASAAGLTTERLDSDAGGRVTMRVPAVKPAMLLRWIAELETADGIIVDRLAITRNGDQTIAADLALRDARR
ncbi:type II secretion system protein GspM [Sandarakinorhabdus sp. DWP1-3-1]|uniref:type II secretion system protein GspM n=1 Tax=Sandarakinorhabdus sp. DWP1-3-1 TaxID=2804627 RepID=UPI003CF5BCE0